METTRLLAFAVASGRVGSVFLIEGRLVDWQISGKAANNEETMAAHVESLIHHFSPTLIITEAAKAGGRTKGQHSRSLIATIGRTAQHSRVIHVSVPRPHHYQNKYAEADALVRRFPQLAPWKPPKRCFYDSEPRNTVLFEALSLAVQLLGHE